MSTGYPYPVVERAVAEGRTVYGVTTGFGALAATRIPPGDAIRVQQARIASHAAGMGALVEVEVVRAMQLPRARTLAAGRSGVRPEIVRAIVGLLNAGITPAVPEIGSLGASGDLAPLAHAALPLVGAGVVTTASRPSEPRPAAPVLEEAGLRPVTLQAKEGLSLLNGTEGMLAHLCLAVADLDVLLRSVDVTFAMSVEALLPQVHGAARDALAYARGVAAVELTSVTDNPVVFAADGAVASTGNFHGQPLAYGADFVELALAGLGGMVERRVDRLMDPARSAGLPPFLAPEAGVNSGFMLAHYTGAALVNRLRGHAAPSSIDSVPTSGGQEDHVSMGWNACRSLRLAVTDTARLVAIEAVCAAEATELRGLPPGPATQAAIACIRREIPRMDVDRFLAPDLEVATSIVAHGALLAAVEATVGSLA